MEPINTRNSSLPIRQTPIKSSSSETSVVATNNSEVRPEFVSPKGVIDAKSGVYVVQFRNAATGNVNFQYPNKKVVAEYARSDSLVPAPETKSQGSTSTSIDTSGNTSSVKVATSTQAVASAPAPSSSGSVDAAPLGTTNND